MQKPILHKVHIEVQCRSRIIGDISLDHSRLPKKQNRCIRKPKMESDKIEENFNPVQESEVRKEITKLIPPFIRTYFSVIYPGDILALDDAPPLITDSIISLRVCDLTCPAGGVNTDEADYIPHLFCIASDIDRECPANFGDPTSFGTDETPFCMTSSLPNQDLCGLWETLHYGEEQSRSVMFKTDLLQYIITALRLSMAGIDPHVISWNRLILFHGPPGTGKTSLSKALAQKCAIRLWGSFPRAKLVEINAHSLFSRWFSESGKQVLQLFQHIYEIAEDKQCLVFVLVDEVESLAAARRAAMNGNEPSDSIRVVNALLTQLDNLKNLSNVVVLTTSNITGAIDVAFLDRADKIVFVGLPGLQARIAILRAGTEELIQKGLVLFDLDDSLSIPDLMDQHNMNEYSDGLTESVEGNMLHHNKVDAIKLSSDVASPNHEVLLEEQSDPSAERLAAIQRQRALFEQHLHNIGRKCKGMSGRKIKKLPFLSFSRCSDAFQSYSLISPSRNNLLSTAEDDGVRLSDYLVSLFKCIQEINFSDDTLHD